MALSTQCPHCHTTFRVAQDQLKLRDGLVRCGQCKEVFNGIEHLLPSDWPAQAPAVPIPPQTRTFPENWFELPLDDGHRPEHAGRRSPSERPPRPLPKFTPAAPAAPETAAEEPNFVKRGRRKQRMKRISRILMGIGSVILLLGLMAQSLYALRNQIALWLPQTKPLLEQACAVLACRIDLPAQIDAVSIESSELQTLAPNRDIYVLTALLRNRSASVQAWPHIELTLNDANEKPLVRRVFAGREYVGSDQEAAQGFAAASEQPIKLFFEVSPLKPAGYRVYLFYP